MTGNRTLMVRGGLWSLVSTASTIAFGLISSLLLVRLLRPSDVGLYFAVLATVTLATTFGSLGLSAPITAFVAETDTEGRRAVIARGLLIAACGSMVVTLLFFVGIDDVVERVVGSTGEAPWWLLALLSAVYILRGLSAHSLVALGELRIASIVRSIPPIVVAMSLLVVWLSDADPTVSTVFVIVLGANAIGLVAALALILGKTGAGTRRQATPAIRRYLGIGLPWLGTTLLWIILMQSGVLIVAGTSSTAQAAEFGVAVRIAAFVAIPSTVVGSVIPPFVSRFWVDRDDRRLERLMRATASISGVAAGIATLLLVAIGRPLLSIAFGDYYAAAWAAMVVLAVGFTVDALTGQSAQMMSLIGRELQQMYVFLAVIPAAVAAMVVLGRVHGSLGVALGLALGVAGSNVASAIVARRAAGIRTWASTSWADMTTIAADVLKFGRSAT